LGFKQDLNGILAGEDPLWESLDGGRMFLVELKNGDAAAMHCNKHVFLGPKGM